MQAIWQNWSKQNDAPSKRCVVCLVELVARQASSADMNASTARSSNSVRVMLWRSQYAVIAAMRASVVRHAETRVNLPYRFDRRFVVFVVSFMVCLLLFPGAGVEE
jgi:hypothetical protein